MMSMEESTGCNTPLTILAGAYLPTRICSASRFLTESSSISQPAGYCILNDNPVSVNGSFSSKAWSTLKLACTASWPFPDCLQDIMNRGAKIIKQTMELGAILTRYLWSETGRFIFSKQVQLFFSEIFNVYEYRQKKRYKLCS